MKNNNYTNKTIIQIENTNLKLEEKVEPAFLIQKNAMSKAYYKISPMGKKLISMAMAVNNMYKTTLNDTHFFEAKFSFQEFFKAMGIEVGGMSLNRIVESANECVSFAINFHTDELQNFMPLFSLIQIDKTNKILRFVFNPIINDFLEASRGHHKIDFLEYGKLRSTYSMRYYDLFEQLRGFAGKKGNPKGSWTCNLSFDEIRVMFQLGDLYIDRPDNFKKFVVDAPVKELNEKIQTMRIVERSWTRTGRRHSGVTFFIMSSESIRKNFEAFALSCFISETMIQNFIKLNIKLISSVASKNAGILNLTLPEILNTYDFDNLTEFTKSVIDESKKILLKIND